MTKQTAAQKRAATAAQAALALTPQEAHNLLQFLDRVSPKGIQESVVYVHLAKKLNSIKGTFKAPNDHKDTPESDE